MMPNDLPPWTSVHQQAMRWYRAGCFESMAHDLRALLRMAQERASTAPTAAIIDSRTLQSTPESGGRAAFDGYKRRKGSKVHVVKHPKAKRGFVLLPRRWVVERSFGWAARFRRLARDYERLASSLIGMHWVAFSILMLNSLVVLSKKVHDTL
jgi:transposase